TLDLDAGAEQATHPATYGALTHDLAQRLNLDTGLAAIVSGGSLPPPDDTQPHQPTSTHLVKDSEQNLQNLHLLDAPARLALRAAPAFRNLRDTLELGELIAHVRDRGLDLALDRDHALANALDLDLDLAHDLARDLARDLGLDLGLDLARALDIA